MTVLLCANVHAAGPNSDAPPNDPETERRAFKVADGFEVNLFASEPMIAKPIGINFDAKGRLWVAGSTTYPQVKPGEIPNDKIYVLEDTKGVGKADKVTVFAEGLFLATAVEIDPHGGVYAANSTELLHLKDTDGDGKADEKRVVFSGFGTEDTHHVIHGFRWDYGGRLNFLQGIYIGSRVETPRGTKVGLASTLWQFRPETMDLGIYCQGLVNPWGVTWDRYGQMFLTDGAGGEGVNFAPPGAQFTAAYGASRVLKGLNPGSPKYCGAQILDGRHIPDDWQGDLLTNDFRANRTVRFKLSEDGSGFSAKLMPDLITSSDRAYRPIDIKMGPDGAIYIADWYNPIINHGEVDFRDPRRDKAHGRIWRVTAKGRPLVEKPKLDGATAEQLTDLLSAPEQWTRLQAKQRLRSLGEKAALPALIKKQDSLKLSKIAAGDLDPLLLEILWTYETLDVPNAAMLEQVIKAKLPHVRAAAVRVADHWAPRVPEARKWVAAAAQDDFPRVRLEAIRALADIGKATGDGTVVTEMLQATDKPIDPVIDFELYQGLSELKDLWLPKLANIHFAKPEHQAYALKTVQSGAALQKIVADLKAGKIADAGKKDAYDLVAAMGAPADVSILLDLAQLTDRFDAAGMRHAQVHDHQIDLSGIVPHPRQQLARARDRHCRVPGALQGRSKPIPYEGSVVGDDDGLG
jgi:glucose/arabinose dehydrogenase